MTHTATIAALDAAHPANTAARCLVGFQLLADQDRQLYTQIESFLYLDGLRAWLARRAAAMQPPPPFSSELSDLAKLGPGALVAEISACADIALYVVGLLQLQDEAPDLMAALGRYISPDELLRHLGHESNRAQSRTFELLDELSRRFNVGACFQELREVERVHINLHW